MASPDLASPGLPAAGECLAQYLVSTVGALTVGQRTWGGVYAMGETELVDGTTVNYPMYAMSLRGDAPQIENVGVVPAVAVEATPHDAVRGVDAQLESAIEHAKRLVAERAAREGEASERVVTGAAPRARRHWSMA